MRHRVPANPRQRALELANVGVDLGGDVRGNLLGQDDAVHQRLRLDDRDPRLETRSLDECHKTRRESTGESLFQIWNFARRGIRTQDDLLAQLRERVEGVEELLLGLLMSREKVDVIDDHDIRGAKSIAEISHPPSTNGFVKEIHERVARDVAQAQRGLIAQHSLADRVQEMGLAQADAAMNEEWVVGAARLRHDCVRRGMRESVSWTHDKRVEGVVRAQEHLLIEP